MDIEKEQYMVRFYLNASGSERQIGYKIFENDRDTWEFMNKLGDRFIERKTLSKPKGYPDAELDFS